MKPTKYKIEIERLHPDGEGKPWEWRVYVNGFDEPAVTGGDRSAAGALYEAIYMVNVDEFDKLFRVHGKDVRCP